MCLLTKIYMQLILPRCGHVANQNHACQQIQVRLNERHFLALKVISEYIIVPILLGVVACPQMHVPRST